MFRPPVQRGMRVLDRSLFNMNLSISAARVFDLKATANVQTQLMKSKSVLQRRLVRPIQSDPVAEPGQTKKCILLDPGVKFDDTATWSDSIKSLVSAGDIGLIPYELHLTYEHWTTYEILSAIIPEHLHEDLPTSFALVGHIAHLNLRDNYMPYKYLIAEVIKDKNPVVETVVNKLEPLDGENEFRVLPLELLAGHGNYQTTHREGGFTYQFDFSTVFWNTRLGTEHVRLSSTFKPGEVVCDVMAGVGPFAIPAAARECFVWANDLNPFCFEALKTSAKLNKVEPFVRTFCENGHTFIKSAAQRLLESQRTLEIQRKDLSRSALHKLPPKERKRSVTEPSTFSHFVMNLPGTAIDFLPNFIGIYAGHEGIFKPNTDRALPMVHVYCFAPKPLPEDPKDIAGRKLVCEMISEKIQHDLDINAPDLDISTVRDVAPHKRQMCASFRLPPEVAFNTSSIT